MEEDLKRFARKLVRIANALAAVLGGLYFVAQSFISDEYPKDKLPNINPQLLALLGAGIVLLNLLRILYFRKGPRRDLEGPLTSHTANGPVQVAREAIVAGLKSSGEELDHIARLRIQVVTPSKKRILIVAQYLAPEGVQILDLSSELRTELRNRFFQMVELDSETQLEFSITFEGFHGKAKAKAEQPEAEKSKEAPLQPFTGPRYPIDDNGEEVG